MAETFNLVSSKGLKWIECEAFTEIPWLVHAFGTRDGGLKPGAFRDNSAKIVNKRPAFSSGKPGRFLKALGAGNFPLASLCQTHSATIYGVSQSSACAHLQYQLAGDPSPGAADSSRLRSGDALMSDHPGILLSVRVADCVPVLMVDRERRAVAAVHAGWRGALERIVEKAVGEMRRIFGSRPENLVAAIGPSIRGCCYEVGEEVVDAFSGKFPAAESFFRKVPATPEESRMALRYQTLFTLQVPPGHRAERQSKVHLDLAAVARYQLEQAGVPRDQIHTADYCTACRTHLFYSYRKEGSLAGRMLAVVGIRSPA